MAQNAQRNAFTGALRSRSDAVAQAAFDPPQAKFRSYLLLNFFELNFGKRLLNW